MCCLGAYVTDTLLYCAGALREATLCRQRFAAAELPHARAQAPACALAPHSLPRQPCCVQRVAPESSAVRSGWPEARGALQVANVAKDIVFDNVSRKKMQDGINKLADAVGVTLGPRGDPPGASRDTSVVSWSSAAGRRGRRDAGPARCPPAPAVTPR